MNNTAERETLLTPGQAAEFLQVSTRTVARWRDEGVLPFVRLPNGRTRYNQKELAVWLDQRARGAR